MKKAIRHIVGQPFVFSTGLAALAHSTWSLGTLFAGKEPSQFTPAWWAWLLPALLIAFSLDVGQIVTSSELREGQRTRSKYATFAIFAGATYYLQWLYISHHMPRLDLAPGVSEWSSGLTMVVRDLAQWIIPALLPMSTLLYTFSNQDAPIVAPIQQLNQVTVAEVPMTIEPPTVSEVPLALEPVTVSEVTTNPFLAESLSPNGRNH